MLTVIVPFRLESSRFPNKAISLFKSKALLTHALSLANKISNNVILTSPHTDFLKVRSIIKSENYEFIESSESCNSATDRVLEIYKLLKGEIFITLPIDEPSIDPEEVNRVSKMFKGDCATLYCDFYDLSDALSPLSAKIVLDVNDYLIYISRAVIPLGKDGEINSSTLKKNVGVLFFSRQFLEGFSKHNTETCLDRFEGLEQLRLLELGFKIKAFKIKHVGFGIDVPTQIKKLEERMR